MRRRFALARNVPPCFQTLQLSAKRGDRPRLPLSMQTHCLILRLALVAVTTAQIAAAADRRTVMRLDVTSTAFEANQPIPKQYTGDGADVSPPLAWSGVPEQTKSIAVIMDDPNAPRKTWVHWVLYDLPADAAGLPRNVPKQQTLDNGAKQGTNDFRGW
jgi:phosphatidylethanolamine-binding protein (PEBP) family uncharacterized protein